MIGDAGIFQRKVTISHRKQFWVGISKKARSYSRGDVKYFVVWDEPSDLVAIEGITEGEVFPNNYWNGTFEDFWKLYKQLADTIDADSELKDLIKLGHPGSFYNSNYDFTGEDSFLKKLVETNTRMDFLVIDEYIYYFWNFVDPKVDGGLGIFKDIQNRLKTEYGYDDLEIIITAFGFIAGSINPLELDSADLLLGYCTGNPFFKHTCPTGKDFNYESHYGAALLASFLIYAEENGVSSFIWESPIGGSGPLFPLDPGGIFSAKAKLPYGGLTYKMFSKMSNFDNEPAIKVTSNGVEFNYDDKIEDDPGHVVGYKNQDTIQILSSKSEDKNNINILVSNWNVDPKQNRYDGYNIKIEDTLDGNYNYKIFVIDKDHTYPDRCDECPWWDDEFKNQMPPEFQEAMDELEGRCDELKAVYCPVRANDNSRYEGELEIAKKGIISSVNGVINLQINNVQSSAVHLIEIKKQ